MCYDSQTSMNAWILNLISCITLFAYASFSKNKINKDDLKIIAIFFVYLGVMQIYDYTFWKNPPPSDTNQNVTAIAMLTNYLQPVILLLLVLYFKRNVKPTGLYITIGYVIVAFSLAIKLVSKLKYTKQTVNSGDSLYWEWVQWDGLITLLYTLSLFFLFYQNLNKPISIISAGFVIVSFLFSLYKHHIEASVGRFWCYFGSFFPMILLGYILLKNYLVKNK